MSYIFLDESGDLGFDFNKKRTSKYFVVTFLFCDNKKPIEKIVKKIHKGLRKKYRIKSSFLHAAHEEPVTILRLCKKIILKNCKVMTIYLNKTKVYTNFRNEKAILYNYVTNILLDRIMTKRLIDKSKAIELIASKRETNKFLNENFKNYLAHQVRNNHSIDIEIKIKTPHEEKSLQAVDFLSWVIFRKYEYNDDSYYNVIKTIIIEEAPLFP
jgi:hypothetical protein